MKKIAILLLTIMLFGPTSFLICDSIFFIDAINPTRGTENWAMDMNISDVSQASFIGEEEADYSGKAISGVGDVNGDGFGDFVIGAWGNRGGGCTYLILGKETDWSMDTDLSDADALFFGKAGRYSGFSVSGAGDVNGDGFDDILIGAHRDDDGGIDAGHTFLIFGKKGGLFDIYLSQADASFIGVGVQDESGFSISGAGDVNGDGYDDILIGSPGNDMGGGDAGQTYLIFGKESGWRMDTSLSNADASFIGENEGDESGASLSSAGDVNNDNFDDILIRDREGNTYLIFGKAEGWYLDTSLSNADVKFFRERIYSYPGAPVSGAGDVNGDGFDDILIGEGGNDEGGSNAGQSYLIFGKETGWTRNTNLTEADASFIGESIGDLSGRSVSGIGDVNLDGYDDILIGADRNDEGGLNTGQSYLIFGKKTGWAMGINLTEADASFIGENSGDLSGNFISSAGDVNGDGSTDILIGSQANDEGGDRAGQTYLIFGDSTSEPNEVYSVELFDDITYSVPLSEADIGDLIFIEVVGLDGNVLTHDATVVNVTSLFGSVDPSRINCIETGVNTGIYRGTFIIPPGTTYLDELNFSSSKYPDEFDTVLINTFVLIGPINNDNTAVEDTEYRSLYWNHGWSSNVTWTVNIDDEWLRFDHESHELYGIPDNRDVGITEVSINLSDDMDYFDVQEIRLTVENVVPIIITEPVTEVKEGDQYHCDFNSTDDGQGDIKWSMTGANSWMSIDETTGWLTGIPTNEDVGIHNISIIVDDGNGGVNSTEFQLTVIDLNMKPIIFTKDITTGTEGERYYRDYEAHDPDNTVDLIWELTMDANFLTMDPEKGILEGTPGQFDVGEWNVNVTVKDLGGLMDSHNFILTIENVNDKPIWREVPDDIAVKHGEHYTFVVNASDPDPFTILVFSINSNPNSDILIDPETGVIEWTASIQWFDMEPYELDVTVKASDGELFTNHYFTITVIPTEPPSVDLIGPNDGVRSSSTATILEWEGTDPEDEPLTFDIYLHQTEAFVQGLREEAHHESDFLGNSITLNSLEQGRTYYWTVVPNDGCSFGSCTSGVQSFKVNYRPTFRNIEDQEVPAGTDFKYKISCTDEDAEDLPNLRYSLVEAPDGMTISEETGMIRWTPKDDQMMLHAITVGVSDGIETNTATFEIEVIEGESSSSSLLIIILIVVIVAILLSIGIFFFVKQKKRVEEEALKRGEEERAAIDNEREGEYASYENLYGIPAPEKDEEELTTKELKDYIHGQIEELEKGE